jgi:hypothetical protein
MRFWADGETMRWECERCGTGGEKAYASAADARRYATAFDREDRDELGRRSPFSVMPLRLMRRKKSRNARQ